MKESKKEKKAKRPKKEKVVYIDDGSTVVDMSGFDSARRRAPQGQGRNNNAYKPLKSRTRFKDCAKTYFDSVKMMLVPMIVVLLILGGLYLLLAFLLWLA